MNHRYFARIPHPPLKFFWRHTPKGDDHLFSEIRKACQRGAEVRIQRFGCAPYSIVLNDRLWLVRPIDGSPIGTFKNIAAAVLAGDQHLDDGDNGFDDHPRGAA